MPWANAAQTSRGGKVIWLAQGTPCDAINVPLGRANGGRGGGSHQQALANNGQRRPPTPRAPNGEPRAKP
eukprot:11174182-Lingulodinium_polyedra.AAC.1